MKIHAYLRAKDTTNVYPGHPIYIPIANLSVIDLHLANNQNVGEDRNVPFKIAYI